MRLHVPAPRLPRRLVFWGTAAASLLAAHDAVWLTQVGPGEPLARALRGGGHAYWETASTVLAVAGLLALVAVLVRLLGLRRRARAVRAPAPATIGRPARAGLTLHLWLRLFAIVAVGFAVQENVEHLATHDHLIGLAALVGPEYPLALPVLGLVTGLAAAAAAALLGVERRLLATIAASFAGRRARAPRTSARPPARIVVARRSPLARRQAGRGPPPRLVPARIG